MKLFQVTNNDKNNSYYRNSESAWARDKVEATQVIAKVYKENHMALPTVWGVKEHVVPTKAGPMRPYHFTAEEEVRL